MQRDGSESFDLTIRRDCVFRPSKRALTIGPLKRIGRVTTSCNGVAGLVAWFIFNVFLGNAVDDYRSSDLNLHHLNDRCRRLA